MQEGYQTADLGNAPRFSGSLDHLGLDPKNKGRKQQTCQLLVRPRFPEGDGVPMVLPSDHTSEKCQGTRPHHTFRARLESLCTQSYRSLPIIVQDSAPWGFSEEDAHCSLDLVLDHKTRSVDAGKEDIVGVDLLI